MIPIHVFTRFSFLSDHGGFNLRGARYHRIARFIPGGWRRGLYRRTKPQSLDDIRKFLFEETRLKERFHYFETICLPSIANQSDPGVQHHILTSAELPGPWSDRLDEMAQTYGFTIHRLTPAESIAKTAAAIAQAARSDNPAISARLDDDDAVDRDFFARIRDSLDGKNTDFAVLQPRGLQLILRRGASPVFTRYHAESGSQGQTLVEYGSEPTSVFGRGPHTKMAKHTDIARIETETAYIVTSHIHNNSNRFSRGPTAGEIKIDVTADQLKESFGIDLAALSATP